MKKIFFLSVLAFQFTFIFAQNTQWGSWTPVSCFSSLSTSVLGNGYVPSVNEYSWQVKIKSAYSKKVTFNMTWIVGGERLSVGEVTLNPGESYGHTPRYFKSASNSINVEIDKVCFEGQDCYKNGYADCNGNQVLNTTSNSSNSSGTQTNNLDAYNRDNQLAQQQLQKQNDEIQRKNQEIATQNAEAQRQQELLKQQQEQQRQQQLQQGINQVTTATVDIVSYFVNRKNALRNSLSQEDGQALTDIANAENPAAYTQNIIQIFTDLGYTLRKAETENGTTSVTMNNDVNNINDLLFIFIHPASYNYYNTISFDYHRKQKLREQLAVLGSDLKDKGNNGFELQGISPANRQKKAEEDQKNLSEKTKSAKMSIEVFEKNNYWNSSERMVFEYAKNIAEAYEDKDALNNKPEAIRYYRKAASIPLDSLTAPWKGDKNMAAYQQKQLGKVCFQLAYLLDEVEGNNGQETIEWYIKSSPAIRSSHYKNIGLIYRFGKGGVAKDWKLAKEYYGKAAAEDDAAAMYNLGKLYETGGPNLEKDESKSKKWFKKACKEDKKYCE